MKKKKREENYQAEMLEGAKLIGAGAATIASAGAAIGIGNVLSSSIHSVARNPSLAKQPFGYAILGFALTEAIASFDPMMDFLISSVWERSWSGKAKTAPHIWVARGRLCPDGGALCGRAQPNRDSTPPTSSAPLYRLNHSKGLIGGTGEPRELADKAAIKAMLVNRVGDFGLAPGISGCFTLFQTVDFSTIFACASAPRNSWISRNMRLNAITLICILLLIGAAGKSAQIGSHTWSPDAMEGPTPVSALIHAATMVTAGVFMIASLSLIGFPFPTGFYSKDVILELAYTKYTISGNFAFWLGSVSVLFTSYYSFRSLFLTFLGPTNSFGRDILRCHDAPIPMAIPLILLALGSLFVGYLAKVEYPNPGNRGLAILRLRSTFRQRRDARRFLTLAGYDMKCVTPNAIKSKALVDLLAHFPSGEYEYAPPSEQNSQLQYWRKPTNLRKLSSNVNSTHVQQNVP
ncbi:hypothetical protein L6452_35496 [Arctium lappa]|uniref:Uncharacterized protein n=1 Tax=Arctium lappa TaxID=4217 RepID=A0ACB8Y841_ARCLA|nr:hypothetical protein L6452_35496 [Arctium lappa]